MNRIAVVGAGAAGLGVAYALREADAEVSVFERREEVGGRAATHRRDDCAYDVGANYCKDDDERVSDLLSGDLADGLVDTAGPVWTFDADGEISEGRGDDDRKWTYREGLATLGERLRDASDATVRTGTEVTGLAREGDADETAAGDGGRWRVEFEDADPDSPMAGDATADAVVLTPPAPTTAYLLDRADWGESDAGDSLREDLVEAVADVPYRTLLSVALHYPERADPPYYALVNADKDHELGWVSREECKPGHVPDGESLLVVQPSPEWSRHRYDDADEEIAVRVADLTAELLGDPDRYEFDWADVVRWRDALPDDGADGDVLDRGAEADLFFAGDWVAGEGRVHAALRSGLETGERIADAV
ncbi:FAD-dependent oxidoreductase [Halorussus gelatinilyticus]|uniref:FAD-dependent oxidoreductase n=1 Tax=Halorussus gelatinilyticus TaxID=2937524 RepID=A0A8U0IN18_9EURY|nr:FAD-dependent oxidoreductase [Halorussus gelatinilyticus]UPW01991.1 FAD-dependent oxidoreductase [Halorussus gelatinilyticus]